MAEKGRVFTGARARFSINGVKLGYATDVNGGEEIEYFPIEALDNIEVEEHAPIAYRANLSASKVTLISETLKSLGFFPQVGQSPQEHLQNILLQQDMVCTVEDSKTGKVPVTVEQVKTQARNFRINARAVVTEDVTFVCTRLRDETGG